MKTKLGLIALLLVLTSCINSRVPMGQNYTLDRYVNVEGRQGVTSDMNFYYISSTSALYKYDKGGELVASNEHPFAHIEGECNHLGDIDVYNGEVFAPVNYYRAGVAKNLQIAVYDAEDLSYKYSIICDPSSGQKECSGVAVDPNNQEIWLTDWIDGSYIYCYSLKTQRYLKKLKLSKPLEYCQGLCYHKGSMIISSDDGNEDLGECDNLYLCSLKTGNISLYRKMDDIMIPGEIEGLCFDPQTECLLVLANQGERLVNGIPRGLYEGFEEEEHRVYIFCR